MKPEYFLYALLIAIWVFVDARKNNLSRWWALGVLILPIATPWYFIKARPSGKYWKNIGMWLLGFFVFHMAGPIFRAIANAE